MELHPLLKRQIKKHLKLEDDIPEELINFLKAVSSSYSHYESERDFMQHAMETNSAELTFTNRKLLDQAEKQGKIIQSLKESIREISVDELNIGDVNLSNIAKILSAEVSKRQEAEIQFIRSQEKYRAIIQNMDLGMLETDEEGIIVQVNKKFTDLTGFTNEDLVGSTGRNLLLDKEDSDFIDDELEKRRHNETSSYEVHLNQKNGGKVWALVSAAPLKDEEGNFTGTVGIHFDISQRKEMEREIIEAREEAEVALKTREQFLANISHEIRTPMNGIIGISHLLESTPLQDQQKDYVSAIHQSAQSLLVVINDVLDLAKIQSGKFTIDPVDFDLPKFLWPLERTMHEAAAVKDVQFNIDLDPAIPRIMHADSTRLNQVLTNLCSNAIKFTSEGSVELKIDLVHVEDDISTLRFAVTDTGIGIDASKLDQIFDQFTQADASVTRNFGGTGLGLAIAKQIVGLMNGQIGVESDPGKGSKFEFIIPVVMKDVAPEDGKAPEAKNKDLKSAQILLVEDNEVNQLVAKTLLEQWNAEVVVAANGVIALEALSEREYDIVLMDMQMPVMGGVEATKEARITMQLGLPIIALTANAMKEERTRCLEAGMDDYISKPFDPEILYSKILKHTARA